MSRRFVVALGDSQTRSLSYHRNILAFRLGASNFLNFLSPARARITREKVLSFVERFDPECNFLMFLNGDVIQHSLDIYDSFSGDKAKDIQTLECAARSYAELCRDVQSRIMGKVIVASALPNEHRTRESGLIYNQILSASCAQSGLLYFDIWSAISNDGLLEPAYRGDWVHVNHRIASFAIEFLVSCGVLAPDVPRESDFGLRYAYEFDALHGSVAAWGDCGKDDLIIEEGRALWSREYHVDTEIVKSYGKDIFEFTKVLSAERKCERPSILVVDVRDGLLLTIAPTDLSDGIVGVDRDTGRLDIAREFTRLSGRHSKLYVVPDYAELSSLGRFDIVVALDRKEATDEFRQELFQRMQSMCSAFFFLSSQRMRDREMLFNAGFKWVGWLPPDRDSKAFAAAPCLIGALNFAPPGAWVGGLQERLRQYSESRIRQSASEILGAVTEEIGSLNRQQEFALRQLLSK